MMLEDHQPPRLNETERAETGQQLGVRDHPIESIRWVDKDQIESLAPSCQSAECRTRLPLQEGRYLGEAEIAQVPLDGSHRRAALLDESDFSRSAGKRFQAHRPRAGE